MILVLMGFLGSGSGLKKTPSFTVGITDDETVMLDFDDTSFREVLYWARRAVEWHRLGGFIILKSSPGCYHVVFDRGVSWAENMRVVAWVAQLSGNVGLQRWHRMQCIKLASTLRVGPKGEKPSPRIVKREGTQEGRIPDFLENRNLANEILLSLH